MNNEQNALMAMQQQQPLFNDIVPYTQNAQLSMMDRGTLETYTTKPDITKNKNLKPVIRKIETFFDKTLPLGNLRRDKHDWTSNDQNLEFSLIQSWRNLSMPSREESWDEAFEFVLLRAHNAINTTRAINGFEREMQATQIQDHRGGQMGGQTMPQPGGITGTLAKLFGGNR